MLGFRTRDLLVRQRTQLINATRGHLTEYVRGPPGGAYVVLLGDPRSQSSFRDASSPSLASPDGLLAVDTNMSINSGPKTVIWTRSHHDGENGQDRTACGAYECARVSTVDTNVSLQLSSLTAAGCDRKFDNHQGKGRSPWPDRVTCRSAQRSYAGGLETGLSRALDEPPDQESW